ncbi:MAG TPA: tyrosine-protein phosphatase, partial [Gaiellaceae bacterium]
MTGRELAWDGCLNVRDLGGLPLEAGGEIRPGALVRSDNARRLGDEAWRAVVAHGVRTVVDLRFPFERAADPPRELPVEVVHVSVFGEPDPAYFRELDARLGRLPDEVAHTREAYLEFLELNQAAFARAVVAVAGARPGGVLVHCMEGKDRTGLVVALLLRLAGVAPEEIAADYALSGQRIAPSFASWIDEAPDERERERRRRLMSSPAAAMVEVLEELDRRYGGVEAYLRAGGASEAELR